MYTCATSHLSTPVPHDTCVVYTCATSHLRTPVYIVWLSAAIMHLYYARFINHFLHDIGLVPTREPFVNLLTQGMVMGRTYRNKRSGKYLRPDELDWIGASWLSLSLFCMSMFCMCQIYIFTKHLDGDHKVSV